MAKKKKQPEPPVFWLRTISDVVIHYIFARRNSGPVLCSFINAVLTDAGLPPVKQVKVENPFSIKTFPTEKEAVLDILAEDEKQQKFHIEVQVLEEEAFIQRCLYYNTKVFSTQLVKGNDYTKLRPVISIILTDFDLFPEIDRVHTTFLMMAREIPGKVLSEHIQLHFLQLPSVFKGKRTKKLNSALLDWLRFFGFPDRTDNDQLQALGSKDKGLEMAIKAFNDFQNDPKLRDLARRREVFRLDVASSRKTILRRVRAEGHKEGREEGRAEGIAIGEAKGRAEQTIFMFLRSVQWTFGELPDELREKVQNNPDQQKIDRLSEMIAKRQITSLSDLIKHFN